MPTENIIRQAQTKVAEKEINNQDHGGKVSYVGSCAVSATLTNSFQHPRADLAVWSHLAFVSWAGCSAGQVGRQVKCESRS